MAYQFKPDIKPTVFPPRIQQIADEYERHGFEYTGPTQDKDMVSFKEMGYEKRVKSRPDTAYMELKSCYRLLDEYGGNEYMLWKEIRHVLDRDDKDYHVDIVMGKRPRFEVQAQTDEDGNEVGKDIKKWNMEYTTKWDTTGKTLDELIKKSKTKRTEFYIAYVSPDYYTNHTGKIIRIKDYEIYKTKSFEELVLYDKNLEMAVKTQALKQKQ